MTDIDNVRTLRQACWANGYRPIAIWSPGASRQDRPADQRGRQAAAGRGLATARAARPPDAVTGSISSLALNTGILTGTIAGIDVDVLAPWLADAVVHRIEHMLGPTPLTRTGRPPKMLLVYRLERPLPKLSTPEMFLPDASKVQVEILGEGQQFVCDGLHPDTGQPYRWTDGSPADVAITDLPVVDETMLREMLEEVERLLREAGAVGKEKPAKPGGSPKPRRKPREGGSDFFRNVNTAALDNVAAWVQQLFPDATHQPATGARRVSSEDLGRDLEEDISIHPDGIRDFGEEEPRTPIDLVIEYGDKADALAAARWLCEQLDVDPTSLGWRAGNGFDESGFADLENRSGPTSENIEPDSVSPEPEPPGGDGRDADPEPGSDAPSVDPGGDDGGDAGGRGRGPEPPQPGDLDPDEIDPPEPDEGDGDDGRLTEEKVEEERARIEAVMEEKLATLNRHFAVVNEAGKCLIMKRTRDPAFDNRPVLERITFDDFTRMYLNRWVEVIVRIVTKKGVEYAINKRPLAPWWLGHARRRQYLGGVTFDPTNRAPSNFLNLWHGFAVKPAPGDWSLMKNHIVKVICRGEEAHAEYVLNWLARLVQRPEEPGEVALVVRSTEKGTGKSLFGRYVVKLFGHHGMHITHAPHLTGRFNAHLHDCCVLFADEAFFAGDKTHEGALKGLITEYTLVIEGKYRNAITVRNRLHVLIVSNKDWVVPASIDERRWAVFEALDIHQGDRAYFRAIVAQMESGGLAAMLHELKRRDISGFEVRDVPLTAALQAQKALSLTSLQRWWLAVLARGFLWRSRHGAPWFNDWHDFYSTELLMRSYQQWCEENRPIYDRCPREQLGAFFSALHPASRPARAHPVYEIDSIVGDPAGKTLDAIAIVTKRGQQGYRVGDLDEARARFADQHLADIPAPWAEPEE